MKTHFFFPRPEKHFRRNAMWRILFAAICALSGPSCFAKIQTPSLEAGTAKVTSLSGPVSILRNATPWAINLGDLVPSQQTIMTGEEGQAEFLTDDGSRFAVSGKTRILLRNEAMNGRDLLDLQTGRVNVITLQPGKKNLHRILTQTAAISFREADFTVAVNEEDGSTRVQVNEGEVAVQHALLPRGEAVAIRADDAISIYKDTPLEGRGTDYTPFYRYAFRALLDALTVVVPTGHFWGRGYASIWH